jgi:hypothetical protein
MKLLNRLSKYLMGVLIGLGLTYIMFNNRGCTKWLPSERIRAEIARGGIVASDSVACFLECEGLTVSDLADLVQEGSVNYQLSGPRETPRRYFIEGDGAIESATYLLTDTATTVTRIAVGSGKECDC